MRKVPKKSFKANRMDAPISQVLREMGYRLVEDAWQAEERITYLNDEDADRQFLRDLYAALAKYGWMPDPTQLRCFRKHSLGELIEIEPGGSETSGHFLHYLKS